MCLRIENVVERPILECDCGLLGQRRGSHQQFNSLGTICGGNQELSGLARLDLGEVAFTEVEHKLELRVGLKNCVEVVGFAVVLTVLEFVDLKIIEFVGRSALGFVTDVLEGCSRQVNWVGTPTLTDEWALEEADEDSEAESETEAGDRTDDSDLETTDSADSDPTADSE